MEKQEIEKARQEWADAIASKATEDQKAEFKELKKLGTFSEMEIIFKVFGWRAPISQKIWNAKSLKQEKMGLNDSVYYLLRVVLDLPLPPPSDRRELTDFTKSELKKLILVGIKNGHVETSGKDPDQSVRSAINEVFRRLKIKTTKSGF